MILLLAHIEAFSQNPLYSSYQHYGPEDGLPQNFISFIAQDSDGFIWVTTLDGLARFDGHDFLVLRKDPKESSSLSFNTIGSGFKDRYGRLWLNYANSEYDCVDPLTLRVITPKPLPAASNDLLSENTSYNAKVRANWGDVNNWLRLDTKQLHDKLVVEMFDPENTRLRSLLMNWPELGKEDIYDLAEDADGKLWILTSKYLLLSDDRGERLSRIDLPDDHQLNPSVINFWPSLAHLKDGRVVVLEGEKMVIYTPETEKWRKIQVPNSHTGKVDLADAILDPQGRFVFDYQGYIYRLESDDRLTLLWHYPEKENIRSLLIDRSNNLWVGTDSDGLYRINLLTPGFRSVTYQNGFIRDVISHELGIPLSKIGVDLKSAYSGRGYHSRYNYTSDGAMTLLMTEAGDNYYISRSIISSIKDGQINVLHTTNLLGSLVEGLKDGVGFVDQWGTHFDWSDIKQPPVSTTAEYPYFEGPKQLLFDDGRYWLATTKSGIYELEEGRIIQNIPPPESYEVNTIRLDPLQKNILWIGTMTGGLYKWDKEAGKLVAAYTMDNGLPNNTINCIIPDAQGYLWMSTNNGISRFNTVAETFSNYSTADGLIQSEFNRHHAITLPDGRMAMGGSKGYSVFHPKDFAEDTSDPAVVIARLTINNKEVDHRYDTTHLPKPVNHLERLDLSYSENSVGFDVAAMQFNAPEKTRYRYQLEGYDKDWVDTEGSRNIRFNKLPYGSYVLHLNASNSVGTWSSEVRKLTIVVHPPFWLTWWAYLIYATVAGFLIRAYWLRYKRILIARQEAQFNEREAARLRELDQTKTRFFSNITHEFRTPLTLILSPLEKHLNDTSFSPKASTLLNNNYRHASQLLRLVNQLLDIAKVEAGQMTISPTAGELDAFIERCVNDFSSQAKENGINLTYSIDGVSGNYLFDQEKLEKILFNLLSNAIKFTETGGKVEAAISTLQLKEENAPCIQIKVSDSGTGIDEDKLTNIFDRFYQGDDSTSRAYEGTGIGLSLVKELVDIMGGSIEVRSVKGEGSTFSVELPIEKLREEPAAMEVTPTNNFRLIPEERVEGTDHDVPVILVVEDNHELLSFLQEMLAANWTVLQASNAYDALSIIERELPEIVISDIMMPGMDGFELCSKIKKDARTNHINVILLTAKAAQESKIEGLELGADAYITKPFHIYELELRIKNLLLEQHHLREHLKKRLLSVEPVTGELKVDDIFLTNLLQYLDQHISDTKLRVETVAEAMNMSKSTLNRKMKALLNISTNDYLKKYRLQQAALLLTRHHTVSEVAFQVGFETTSYFTTCFKEMYQMTPSEFRLQAG